MLCTFQIQRLGGRCEDAFFFSSKAAGVADGVGQMEQFSEYGVDAAKRLGSGASFWVLSLLCSQSTATYCNHSGEGW